MKIILTLVPLLIFGILLTEATPKKRSRQRKERHLKQRRWGAIRKHIQVKDRKFITGRKLKKVDITQSLQNVKDIKKNEHYIDPDVLAKFHQVKDMKDFLRIFKPSINKGSTSFSAKSGDTPIAYAEQVFDQSCSPRETAISLQTLGKVTYPSCTSVKRCSGCCPIAKECVAATITKKEVSVFEITGYDIKQVTKTLDEHSSCKCDCIVKETDCLPKQTFAKDRCQCECHRSPDQCSVGKSWSTAACDCVCAHKQTCTSTLKQWDEASCSCKCVNTPCPLGQIRNPENCFCVSYHDEPFGPFDDFILQDSHDSRWDDVEDDTDSTGSQDKDWGDF